MSPRRKTSRAAAKTAILSIRLRPEEKRYLELATQKTGEEVAKLAHGVPLTVSSFVRWAALQSAEQRLGVSLGQLARGRGRSGRARHHNRG